MRDILLTIIIFSSIPFIVKRPYFGIIVFAWLAYMNPHRMTYGFAYNMPFSEIIGFVTIAAIILKSDYKGLPMQYLIMYVWIGWIVWMNITAIFALEPDPGYTNTEWVRAIKIQMVSLLTLMVLQDKHRLVLFIWVVVISIGFYSVKGGFFTLVTAGNHIVFGPAGTFIKGNNALAIAVLMIVPLAWFLYQESQSKKVKVALLMSIILSMFTVIASYSRGAFLAAAAVGFYFILKSKKKLIIIPLVLTLAGVMLSMMPDKYFDRLETIQTYDQDASAMGRVNAWYFAWNLAKDRPIVGGGFGAFEPKLFWKYAPEPLDFHDAHSIYFEVLGEHGFVGLALFIILGALSLRMANKTRNQIRGNEELRWAYNLLSMLYVSMIAYAVGGLFLGLAYFDLYYHILCMIIITKILVDKSLNNKELPESLELDARL